MRLNGIIAVVLVVTMTTLCTGCFALMRPVNNEWRFGYMSQAVNDGSDAFEIIPLTLAVILVVAVLVAAIAIPVKASNKAKEIRERDNISNIHNLSDAVCDHWEKCGKWDRKGCVLYHSSVVQSKECLEKQLEAKCDEYNSKEAEYRAVCWPPCKPGPEKCDKSRRLICDDGGLVVIDCAKWCESKGKDYAGSCNETPDGKTRCECR